MVKLIPVEQTSAALLVIAGQVQNAAEQIRAIAEGMRDAQLETLPIPNQTIFAGAIDAIDTYVKGARKALRDGMSKGPEKPTKKKSPKSGEK